MSRVFSRVPRAIARNLPSSSLIAVLAMLLPAEARAALEPDIAVVFLLDESGSIDQGAFSLQKDGFASALERTDVLPHDGSLEVGVVAFSTSARTIAAPEVLTSASSPSLATTVRATIQARGSTNLAGAVQLGASLLASSPAPRKVLIVSTDGQPDSAGAARSAADAAIASGITEIHAIGVGSANQAFLASFVRPVPTEPSPGRVLMAATFVELADAVRELLGIIIDDDEHVVRRLDVSGLPASVAIGAAVPVTVTAVNAAGRRVRSHEGPMTLRASGGIPLTPLSATMTAGRWSGDLRFWLAGDDVFVLASSGGHGGRGGPFRVGLTPSPSLSITVRDSCDGILPAGVPGVTVTLRRAGAIVASAPSDARGRADFGPLPAGEYVASAPGFHDLGLAHAQPRTSWSMCRRAPGDPVVLVPGIMGSHQKWGAFVPELPGSSCGADRDQLAVVPGGLGSLLKSTGARELRTAIEDAGFSVTEAPWDWRCGVATAVDEYLIPAIDEAKRATGRTEVTLVAHSMGGLLARHYVESADHADRNSDVAGLVMIGTPNSGAAIPYFMVEGGSPQDADRAKGDRVRFYSRVSEGVFERQRQHVNSERERHMFRNRILIPCWPPNESFRGLSTTVQHCWEQSMLTSVATSRSFYETIVPSVGQLLATYDVKSLDGRTWEPLSSNTFLKSLNERFVAGTRGRYSADGGGGTVRALLIASSEISTLARLEVVPLGTEAYPSGWPVRIDWMDGDGTVPCTAAIAPFHERCESIDTDLARIVVDPQGGEHAKLMDTQQARVVDWLNEGAGASSSRATAPLAAPAASMPFVQVQLDGILRARLDLPQGQLGVAADGSVSVPDDASEYLQLEGIVVMTAATPPAGRYPLHVVSEAGIQAVPVRVRSMAGSVVEEQHLTMFPGESALTGTLVVDGSGAARLEMPCGQPAHVALSEDGGLVRLDWEIVQGATDYAVFGTPSAEGRWSLLAVTPATGTTTSVAWSDTWELGVVARCAQQQGAASDLITSGPVEPALVLAATPVRGRAPLHVQLGVQPEASDVEWHLDAVPGPDASGNAVTHAFTTPGFHGVAVTGKVDGRTLTVARTHLIEVLEPCMPGDVSPPDGDGRVTLADFLAAVRALRGRSLEGMDCADVFPGTMTCRRLLRSSWCTTGDGAVTLADALVVGRMAIGLLANDCAACGAQVTGVIRTPGDVAAGDGVVNVADVVRALRAAIGLETLSREEIALADVAPAAFDGMDARALGDGRIDVADVVLLLRASVGQARISWPIRRAALEADLPVGAAGIAASALDWIGPAPTIVPGPGCASEAVASEPLDAHPALACATTGDAVIATLEWAGPRQPAAWTAVAVVDDVEVPISVTLVDRP